MRTWMILPPLLVLAGCSEPPKTAPQAAKTEAPKTEAPKTEAPPQPARITHFYISPEVIEAGRQATLCYGVEDARAVRLVPPVEPLRPYYNRCIQIAPERDTRYTLFAEGSDGREVSLSVQIKVQQPPRRAAAPPPVPLPPADSLILEFVPSASEIRAGQPVTFCYKVAPGAAVRLEPDVERSPGASACFTVSPRQTTTYTLTASEPGGRTETRQLTLTVR